MLSPDDCGCITQYRCDPDMVEILCNRSMDTLEWIRSQGVRFVPKYGVHAFKHNERFTFHDALVVSAVGGGKGLVAAEISAAEKNGGGVPV